MACKYITKCCADENLRVTNVTSTEINDAYKNNQMDGLFTKADVTFFDDIDIEYLDRKAGNGKIACALLAAMNGMNDSEGFRVRIFTTNEDVRSLDTAFTRAGRIDRIIRIEKPDSDMRRKAIMTWDTEILNAIDVEKLIRVTEESSFTDLEAIKAYLVTEYLFGSKKWELGKAVRMLRDRGVPEERPRAGFIVSQPPKVKELTEASA